MRRKRKGGGKRKGNWHRFLNIYKVLHLHNTRVALRQPRGTFRDIQRRPVELVSFTCRLPAGDGCVEHLNHVQTAILYDFPRVYPPRALTGQCCKGHVRGGRRREGREGGKDDMGRDRAGSHTRETTKGNEPVCSLSFLFLFAVKETDERQTTYMKNVSATNQKENMKIAVRFSVISVLF